MIDEQKTFGGSSLFVRHRETRAPRPDASRKLSLGSMMRKPCPRCSDPEALFAGSRCCSCGADLAEKPKRGRGRPPRAFALKGSRATAPLRTPIADNDANLLALMAAKP
jgi:hypothetical protein